MLTIHRSLPFQSCFSVFDDREDGAVSDLSSLDLRSQMRESTATDQEYPFVVDVPVTITDYGFRLDLPAETTATLPWDDYLIDVVSTMGQIILPKTPIKVVGHVTLPDDPDDVPNFVTIFLAALND